MSRPEANHVLFKKIAVPLSEILGKSFVLEADPLNLAEQEALISAALSTDKKFRYTGLAIPSVRLVGSRLMAVFTDAIPSPDKMPERQTINEAITDWRSMDSRHPTDLFLQDMHPPLIGPDWNAWNVHDRTHYIETLLLTDPKDAQSIIEKETAKLITEAQATRDLAELITNQTYGNGPQYSFWVDLVHTNFGSKDVLDWKEDPHNPVKDSLKSVTFDAEVTKQVIDAMPFEVREAAVKNGLLSRFYTIIQTDRLPGRIYRPGAEEKVSIFYNRNRTVTLEIDQNRVWVELDDNGEHKKLSEEIHDSLYHAPFPFMVIKTNLESGLAEFIVDPDQIPKSIWIGDIWTTNPRLGMLTTVGSAPSIRDQVPNPVDVTYTDRYGREVTTTRNLPEGQVVVYWPATASLRQQIATAPLAQAAVNYKPQNGET